MHWILALGLLLGIWHIPPPEAPKISAVKLFFRLKDPPCVKYLQLNGGVGCADVWSGYQEEEFDLERIQ